ncbi:MAG: CoB--CoM heterodisulfide reductase iron-sulfur subunit B family protein [Phycisphaerae bacterium]
MNPLGYYPGCSLTGSASEYDISLRAVAEALNEPLQEIPQWVCCGASCAHAINHSAAFSLAADSLSKARRAGMDRVLAPCAMCYSRLAAAVQSAKRNASMAHQSMEAQASAADVDITALQVINVLSWLENLPAKAISQRVTQPLKGLKVACYYGCLLVRPPAITGAANVEAPRNMEGLVNQTGAQAVRWSMALECCGAGFSLSSKQVVLRQGRKIFAAARESGADLVVLACPMCHSNLDMRQAEFVGAAPPMPVLYLTQLIGLALGLPEESLGMDRHFVPVEPTLTAALQSAGSKNSGKRETAIPRGIAVEK